MAFKKFLKSIFEIIAIAAVAVFVVILCRHYVFNPYAIAGTSMAPTFHDGDYVFVDELSYRFHPPARGDIVVFHAPFTADEDLIKRVIGLPEERVVVNNDKVVVYNKDKQAYYTVSERLPYRDKKFLDSAIENNQLLDGLDERLGKMGDQGSHGCIAQGCEGEGGEHTLTLQIGECGREWMILS